MKISFLIFAFIYCLSYETAIAQQKPFPFTVSGKVFEEKDRHPLSLIDVRRQGVVNTVSSEDGSFSLLVTVGDTIVFSRLGYDSTMHIIEDESFIEIFMKEKIEQLNEVIIYDKLMLPGLDELKKQKPVKRIKYENATMTGSLPNTVPVFGPGVAIRFGSENRKIKKRIENDLKTRVYALTINSPEVKAKLMSLYSISEKEYYKKIEIFNVRHPEAAYVSNNKEIMEMLIQFFALKEK